MTTIRKFPGAPELVRRMEFLELNKDLRAVVAEKDVIEHFQQLGTYSRDLTPQQTDEFMRNEEKLWWPVVRQVEAEAQKPAAK